MTLFKLAISSAFVTGALTAGAFITGTALGYCAQKKNIVNKFKQKKLAQLKGTLTNNADTNQSVVCCGNFSTQNKPKFV